MSPEWNNENRRLNQIQIDRDSEEEKENRNLHGSQVNHANKMQLLQVFQNHGSVSQVSSIRPAGFNVDRHSLPVSLVGSQLIPSNPAANSNSNNQ